MSKFSNEPFLRYALMECLNNNTLKEIEFVYMISRAGVPLTIRPNDIFDKYPCVNSSNYKFKFT